MARGQRNFKGGKLRKHRRLAKLQQKDVAKKFGLQDTAMISRWEHGESTPSLENAFMLARLYRVLVDDLFYDVGTECLRKLYPNDPVLRNRRKV